MVMPALQHAVTKLGCSVRRVHFWLNHISVLYVSWNLVPLQVEIHGYLYSPHHLRGLHPAGCLWTTLLDLYLSF